MNIKNHIIFNILIIFLIKNFNILKFSIKEWNIILFISIISCFIPDIDHPNSFIGRKTKFISKKINKMFGHREITHSILFLFIIYIILKFFLEKRIKNLFKPIYYGVIIGFFTHLIGDMLTKKGISLLWPIKYKFRFRFLNIFLLLIIFFYLIDSYCKSF